MSRLRDKDIEKITHEYSKAKQAMVDAGEQTAESLPTLLESVAVDKYLRVVDMSEIEANGFNLNISSYIDTSDTEEEVDIKSVLKALRHIDEKILETDQKLLSALNMWGL